MEKLFEMIATQQCGHVNDDVFMVGEQLKDMVRREPGIVEILKQDLTVKEMSIEEAAKKLKAYADANHRGAKCFCVTPIVAEGILREFYGLPKRDTEKVQETAPAVSNSAPKLDLSDFL